MKNSAIMRWLKRGRLVSAVSRSTGDLLKAIHQSGSFPTSPLESAPQGRQVLRQNTGPKDRVSSRQQGLVKTGYLYVLTDAGFWFRMWVVLRVGRLETFYESTDTIPMETVSLCGGKLVTPRAISSDCPDDVLYPMQVFKEGHPTICLAAESADEQRRWTESLRSSLQASSLDMEGLNLEGHGGCDFSQNESLKGEGSGGDTRVRVLRKLDLLDELLAQKDELMAQRDDHKGTDKAKELCQKLEGLEQWYERVLMSEQREALRRATHLRQRKISTQLKADTIREQLRSSRKLRPKSSLSFREKPREADAPSAFYEGQLRELTDQLNLIHSRLGREEAHSEVASRKLYRKRDHEIHRLHSDTDVIYRKAQGVSKSQEDCRIDNRRSTGLRMPKNNNTVSMIDLNRTPGRNRLSPLRFLGNLVDAAQVRRRRRNNSEELLPGSREVEDLGDNSRQNKFTKRQSQSSTSSSSTSSEKLRTEIDPTALAEIQAFEELAEQVLNIGKPSAESPTPK